MLNVHNLSISFQGDYLFEEITFKLSPGDRVGLIGKNGAGKSTMLKILSKEIGRLRLRRDRVAVRLGVVCVRVSRGARLSGKGGYRPAGSFRGQTSGRSAA